MRTIWADLKSLPRWLKVLLVATIVLTLPFSLTGLSPLTVPFRIALEARRQERRQEEARRQQEFEEMWRDLQETSREWEEAQQRAKQQVEQLRSQVSVSYDQFGRPYVSAPDELWSTPHGQIWTGTKLYAGRGNPKPFYGTVIDVGTIYDIYGRKERGVLMHMSDGRVTWVPRRIILEHTYILHAPLP